MAEAEAEAAPAHTTAEDSSPEPEQPGHDVAAEPEAESSKNDPVEPAQGLEDASMDAAGPSSGEEGEPQDAAAGQHADSEQAGNTAEPMQQEAEQDAAAGQQAGSEQAGSTAEPMQQEAEQTAVPQDDQREQDTPSAHADAAEQVVDSPTPGIPAVEAPDEAAEPAAGELVEAESELKAARSMQDSLQETAAAAVDGMPGLPEAVPAAAAEAVVDSTEVADAPAAEVTQLPAASAQVDAADNTSTAVVAAQQAAAAAAAEADTVVAAEQAAAAGAAAAEADAGLSEPLPAPTVAPAPAEPGATDQDARQPSRAYFKDGVGAIDVEVDCGPGMPCKLLHVTMDVSALQVPSKPFLGGFKHKQQGTIYHHASIQTPQDQTQSKTGRRQQPAAEQGQAQQQQEGCEGGVKLTRQTQTVKETSCSSQTVREAATQMAKVGLLLDCSADRVLTPRPYVTAAVVDQRWEAAALTIQRFSRGWFARKRAGVLRDIKAERDAFLAETAAESAQAAYDQKRHEVERRRHPLSKADFALLEAELESWRQQQTAAIKNAGLVHQEEQAALQLLLAKETRLLHTLDKLRVAAHQEKRATGRQKALGALAQPKAWPLSNGKKVLVHTPLTVLAAELQQLYCGLTLPSLSLDERLDVLLHVKWVAKEWDSSATRELVELIDREADLLNRGRSPKTLDGLRKRIAGLFLTCCQSPAFNPEAARLRINAVGPNGPEAFEYVLEAATAQ